jgi:hypothetical protein
MQNNGSRAESSRGDATRVNVEDPYEIRRWCQRFICTEAALRAAVAEVGENPDAVRRVVALGNTRRAARPRR